MNVCDLVVRLWAASLIITTIAVLWTIVHEPRMRVLKYAQPILFGIGGAASTIMTAIMSIVALVNM